jgi:hypothetical protein
MTDFESVRAETIAELRAMALLLELDADKLSEDPDLVARMHQLDSDLRCWWTARRQHEAALIRLDEGSYTTADVQNAAESHAAGRVALVQTCARIADRAAWLRELAEQEVGR